MQHKQSEEMQLWNWSADNISKKRIKACWLRIKELIKAKSY